MPNAKIKRIDNVIRRDPARRGIIASEAEYGPLCAGHLGEAARELAQSARFVGIVTGFYVPHGELPAAETDGLLGALMLAHALRAIGIEVTLITDEPCAGALRAAAEFAAFPIGHVHAAPLGDDAWAQRFLSKHAGRLTHLVAIERPGPSHCEASISMQPSGPAAETALERFRTMLDPDQHDRHYNMRGTAIDAHTAPLHRLFEELPSLRPAAKTIGIGDGGNEIGMGCVPWGELERRLEGEHSARIICRIATDWNIIAGTTNWGGCALAAAVLLHRDRVEVLRDWDGTQQLRMLEHIVEHGPAVDGVTARREATVDGLPFPTYIQAWESIREIVGFEP